MNNLKKGTGASIESNISIQPVKDPKTGEVTFQLTLPIQYIDFFPLTQNPDTMDTGEDGGKLVMNESLDEPEDG
jgi:hypothetical protein